MADIKNSISLRDSMSGTLGKIINKMTALSGIMSSVSSDVNKFSTKMGNMGKSIEKTFSSFNHANTASLSIANLTNKINNIPNNLQKKLSGIGNILKKSSSDINNYSSKIPSTGNAAKIVIPQVVNFPSNIIGNNNLKGIIPDIEKYASKILGIGNTLKTTSNNVDSVGNKISNTGNAFNNLTNNVKNLGVNMLNTDNSFKKSASQMDIYGLKLSLAGMKSKTVAVDSSNLGTKVLSTGSNFKSTSTEANNLGNKLSGLSAKLKKASSDSGNLGSQLSGLGSIARSSFAQFTAANIAANAIMNLAEKIASIPQGLINASDSFASMQARLQLVSEQFGTTTEQTMNKIYQSSIRSRGEINSMTNIIAKLGLTTGEVFGNTDEIVQFGETMNKAFALSGATQTEKSNALNQMAQALGSGVLQGDELRSIRENAPLIFREIAKYMGVPAGAIKELAAEGEVTADIVKNAVLSATEEINNKFNTLPRTWEQNMITIKNAGVMAFANVYRQISKIANSEFMSEFAENIVVGMKITGNAIASVINEVRYLGGIFAQYGDIIKPIILTIVASLGIMAARFVATGIAAVAMSVSHTVATIAQTAAIIGLEAAQYGLNAALALCPLTWILYGIVAIIGVFYLAVAAVNHFAGTSVSATGIILGVFASLGSVIWNIVARIYNVWAIFFEFIINSGHNAGYATKMIFINMATTFLDACIAMTKGWDGFATSMANAIIQAVNIAIRSWNNLVSILPDKIKTKLEIGGGGTESNMIGQIKSVTGAMQAARAGLVASAGKPPIDYRKVDRMQEVGMVEAYQLGYGYGEKIVNKVAGLKDEADKLTQGGLKKGAPFSGELDKDKPKKVKVKGGKLDKDQKVEIAEENLKILTDLARREAQLNYQHITPEFSIVFNGDIKETVDVGNVMDIVEQRVIDIYEGNLGGA
ncbi:MAG: tape measure protein [Anaerovoracaceae bacterium]